MEAALYPIGNNGNNNESFEFRPSSSSSVHDASKILVDKKNNLFTTNYNQ